MTNAFATAFADYAPVLAAEFVEYHTRVITRLIEKYDGKLRSRGPSHLNHYDEQALRGSGSFVKYDGYFMDSKAIGVATEWLEKNAKEYGEQTVKAFVNKLTKKLGSLTDVEVKRADSAGQFVITGKLGERSVRVEQQQVFKVSSHGTPFHQWPARIYVDGKFTTEAAFKKLAA